ncbi:MAG: hypothetical protein US95_C0011G0007 [Candidatus Woesebacteria bacterium GW2011_GWB1_38_5]|uniref:Uncharacterized protein n=3 Tax=Candidatus Woeseibacteriota TaxID=1752722 RepID=A0A0G0K853_9BACT|nr:MAG: hypothetical protein US75_C0028G0013 [Candidatus Woesebacteria bacterium GW2011_GWC1_38_13]KKQ75027.1 MAG: hypothetical protein US95_C0011G0007 [Candidatus Woesebacteria bacterium GW2011_GWB1_38_5]KKQ83445.1 MAG: hypothetical protein UT06_C0022G0009 [Candidatus Woesebacteria bacterium GW2011_GWA1_38_8]
MPGRIKKGLFKIILLAVIAIAFFLRIYNISENPPSLNWDEVSLGYNAYSILDSGKDEWGKTLPVIFQAYGDYKLPGYIYILVPFIKLFGLNEFSVRLPSVLAGTISILLTYLIVSKLFINQLLSSGGKKPDTNYDSPITNHQSLALLSSLLVAIEPWSFFLSRPAVEANLALCFFLAGFYFFLRFLHNPYFIIHSSFFLGLSVWTYNSYRIFTPMFIVLLIVVFKKEFGRLFVNRKTIAYCLVPSAFFFLPMFFQLISGVGQERYKKVNIIDDGAIGQIVNLRNKYELDPFFERLIFNQPVYFTYNFSKNVISHFSYKFLFGQGGSNYQFSIPEFGILYKVNAVFLIIGIIYLLKVRNRISILLLGWWILGAIPSSLTREAPHVLRSITILPVPMIITSIGVVVVFKYLLDLPFVSRIPYHISLTRFLIIIYFLGLVISVCLYVTNYFTKYRSVYSWSWQYGYKEAVEYAKSNYQKFDKIIFTKKYGEPHEFVLFYTRLYPVNYFDSNNLIRYRQSDWFWVDRFDKFYFVNDWDIPRQEWQPFVLESGREEVDCRNIKCLLITSPGNVPKTWNLLETVGFPDGKIAFEIYEN